MHACLLQLTSGWSHCHFQIFGFTRVSRLRSCLKLAGVVLSSFVTVTTFSQWFSPYWFMSGCWLWNLHWRCQHVCKHSMQTTSNLVGSKATTRSFLVQRHISPSNQFHSNHSPTGWGIHFVASKLRFPRCAWVITLLCSNTHLLPH